MTPPLFYLSKPRVHRKRTTATTATTPVALNLVAATYDENAPSLTLTFDRAIEIGAFVAGAIVVDDGDLSATRWQATGPSVTMIDPATVRIELSEVGSFGGGGILLDATGASGIMAVDDGGAWGGVSDVELPFP